MNLGKSIKAVLQVKWLSQKRLAPLILLTLIFCIDSAYADQPASYKYDTIYQMYANPRVYFSSPGAACLDAVNILQQVHPEVSYSFSYFEAFDVSSGYEPYASNCHATLPVPYFLPPVFALNRYPSCPEGTVLTIDTCTTTPTANPKASADPGCGDGTQHSISFNAGNEVVRDADYLGFGVISPIFKRTYNSSQVAHADNQGWQWRNSLSRSIQFHNNVTFAYRAGGKIYNFNLTASTWLPDADITDKLTELKDAGGTRTGWTYTTDSTSEIETYDATGKLRSITDRAGYSQNLSYSCTIVSASCSTVTPSNIATVPDMIIKVTDSVGHNLNFSYDASNRIKTMTNPAGGVYTYVYDANNNLSSVTYPDNKTKTYHYGAETAEVVNVSPSPNAGVSYANALTGIVDENGSRYATYRYDAQGRAYDEELAPDLGLPANQKIEHNNLAYNVDASGNPTNTVVTNAFGSARTYNFTTILGVVKSTGQSQPAGSGCAASAAALTYDANGNVASRTDFKGNLTTYAYDMARNLETSRTEGLTSAGTATAATRTITNTYHPTWRLPLVTAEYTGATTTGTALRSTTNVYDAKGNLTSITEADPVRSTSRTTTLTYTYSTLVPGLVVTKVIDGPRTDVSDVTTYNYYDANVTCTPSNATPLIDPITNISPANLGCRGQLQSMTDALGHTTTYDRYNHHGQVEQMTDANGLITTNTYDLRQRLLSRNVSGAATGNQTAINQTTSLTYDGVGQVTQLTMPDASQLNYSYDAAHRLTQVQDSLGNKVTYTLDSEGNRINETTTDPLGTLTKTLTRSYDALNRLQQVVGVQ